MSDGFDFLGFRIRWKRQRGTNEWHVYTFIADRVGGARKLDSFGA
jgi:RNA-directed DNA polymerase